MLIFPCSRREKIPPKRAETGKRMPLSAAAADGEVVRMPFDYEVRMVQKDGLKEALDLIWRVFLEFDAPDYTGEGIREFRDFIGLQSIGKMLESSQLLMWGCYDGEKIVGVLAARRPCHISLLFVDRDYQKQGVAKQLFKWMLDYFRLTTGYHTVTVNASPYAAGIYRRLGFGVVDSEQVSNGIRFIPMKYRFR